MKSIFFIVMASMFACSSNNLDLISQNDMNSEIEIQKNLQNSIKELYPLRFNLTNKIIVENLNENFKNCEIIDLLESKSVTSSNISDSAILVLEELKAIEVSNFSTKEEYIKSLNNLLDNKISGLSQDEYSNLKFAVDISSYIIDIYLEQKIQTKGWWEDWGKCAAGIVGGAGLGALGGAATGSAVPVLGTTAGAIVGGISGGLSGAAAAC